MYKKFWLYFDTIILCHQLFLHMCTLQRNLLLFRCTVIIVSLCMSARISQKLRKNILRMLPLAEARSSFDDNAMSYKPPVLRMTWNYVVVVCWIECLQAVPSLPALGPWAPPAERGPFLESIYRVSLIVDLCEGQDRKLTAFIAPLSATIPTQHKNSPLL